LGPPRAIGYDVERYEHALRELGAEVERRRLNAPPAKNAL
jgi:hypothetical protein